MLKRKFSLKKFSSIERYQHDNVLKLDGAGGCDRDLFHIAENLIKGGMPRQKIFIVLKNLLITWGEELDPNRINSMIEKALERRLCIKKMIPNIER